MGRIRRRVRSDRMAERRLGDWLTYLEQLHPTEIELGLSRISAVATRMGLLPFPAKVVTVAGTNGKGSVVYCTEKVLREAGLRTGRYTSPHLLRYNERIAVDGLPCADSVILDAFRAIEAARDETSLTYFEFATLAALWVFRAYGVDVAILEVGLGGRLDAVNIVDSDVAVITAIALDHQNWLGDTVEAIAPEKAAVARRGRAVILAESDYPRSLHTSLSMLGAIPECAGHSWRWAIDAHGQQLTVWLSPGAEPLHLTVPSGLRPANVAAAIKACSLVLNDRTRLDAAAQTLDALLVPARRQEIALAGRTLVLDVAHNPAAMSALVSFLNATPVAGRSVAALGVMADKDVAGICKILAAGVSGACAMDIPGIDRAESAERLWEMLDAERIAISQSEFSVEAVWTRLWEGTGEGDRIVICGSFHTVANVVSFLVDTEGVWSEQLPRDLDLDSQVLPEQMSSRTTDAKVAAKLGSKVGAATTAVTPSGDTARTAAHG